MINVDLEKYIESSTNILIISSLPIDPDCICSGLILRKYLEHLGKKNIKNIIPSKISNEAKSAFSFLPYFSEIDFENPVEIMKEKKWDTIFLLDGSNLIQFAYGRSEDYLLNLSSVDKVIHIDHHLNQPEKLGTFEIHNNNESSTTEIVLNHIIPESFIDKDIATLGYAGIVGDTGNFKWAIFPTTFNIAALLVERGALFEEIIDRFVIVKSIQRLKALPWIVSNLTFCEDQKIIFLIMTKKIIKDNNFDDKDISIINNTFIDDISKSTEGYNIGIFLKEEVNGKIFVRGRGNNFSNKISLPDLFEKLGGNGGGHFNAACVVVEGDINEIKEKILKYINER